MKILNLILVAICLLLTAGIYRNLSLIYQKPDLSLCGLESVVCPGEDNKPIERAKDAENAILSDSEGQKQGVEGAASWYTYTLPSGWSSVGHYVCAARDFARGKRIKITDQRTGKSVVCLVTDHGPDKKIHPDRVVDLSSTAFKVLAPLKVGIIKNVNVVEL